MIEFYKYRYETCREMLVRLKCEQPSMELEKLSYSGILDPMAEGVVPVLVGENENKNRNLWHGTHKVYQVGILVGVSTDSGDLLGIVKENHSMKERNVDEITDVIIKHPPEFSQTVPMHSNRKFKGKPLWLWILNGVTIPEDERPKNNVRIDSLSLLGVREIKSYQLTKEIDLIEDKFAGRFRSDLVVPSWKNFLDSNKSVSFSVIEIELKVSSGFYVRSFVESVSNSVRCPLCVYSLLRTAVFI